MRIIAIEVKKITLSRFSRSRIKLLFKVVPFFVPAMLLSNWVLNEFLSLFETGNIFIQLFVFLLSIIAGMGITVLVIRRKKRVELL